MSVRTRDNAGIEPIDTLQTKFDALHDCSTVSVKETKYASDPFLTYPNPATQYLHVQQGDGEVYTLRLTDMLGSAVLEERMRDAATIDVTQFAPCTNSARGKTKVENDQQRSGFERHTSSAG